MANGIVFLVEIVCMYDRAMSSNVEYAYRL